MFIIHGRIPSKKNSRQLFVRRGRPMTIPSKAYKKWHKEASLELVEQHVEPRCPTLRWHVYMSFYFPDNRKSDLTNKAESIMDLLVDNGIIKDDSWQTVSGLCLNSRGKCKENPRVIIKFIQDWRNIDGH